MCSPETALKAAMTLNDNQLCSGRVSKKIENKRTCETL